MLLRPIRGDVELDAEVSPAPLAVPLAVPSAPDPCVAREQGAEFASCPQAVSKAAGHVTAQIANRSSVDVDTNGLVIVRVGVLEDEVSYALMAGSIFRAAAADGL